MIQQQSKQIIDPKAHWLIRNTIRTRSNFNFFKSNNACIKLTNQNLFHPYMIQHTQITRATGIILWVNRRKCETSVWNHNESARIKHSKGLFFFSPWISEKIKIIDFQHQTIQKGKVKKWKKRKKIPITLTGNKAGSERDGLSKIWIVWKWSSHEYCGKTGEKSVKKKK